MTNFSHDCPHPGCGTRKAGFSVLHWCRQSPIHIDFFARCGVCRKSIVAAAFTTRGIQISDSDKIISDTLGKFNEIFVVERVYPEPPKVEAIGSLPVGVERAFLDGEANFAEGRYGAAAMRYRTALERALKHLHPDDKGMLNARIRLLADRAEVPQALIDLMDGVKFIGNDAAHDDDDPAFEEVETGRDFTRLLLTYMFELPARVAAASEARNIRRTATG